MELIKKAHIEHLNKWIREPVHSLGLVCLSLFVIVAVSWFGKALLQWLFSADGVTANQNIGKNSELLRADFSNVLPYSFAHNIPFFYLLLATVLLILVVKTASFFVNQCRIHQGLSFKHDHEKVKHKKFVCSVTKAHFSLLIFALLFSITASWLGDNLTNWLTAPNTVYPLAKNTVMCISFLVPAGLHLYEAKITRDTGSFSAGLLLTWLNLIALVLFIPCINLLTLSNAMHVVVISLLLSITYAYWFFEKIKKYTLPSATHIWHGTEQANQFPSHKHLILFLSSFTDHARREQRDQHRALGGQIATQLKAHLEDKDLWRTLANELSQPDSNTENNDTPAFCFKVLNTFTDHQTPLKALNTITPSFVVGFSTQLFELFEPDSENKYIRLSRVIALCAYISKHYLNGNHRIPWQMPIIALQHHLDQASLSRISLVTSEASIRQLDVFIELLTLLSRDNAYPNRSATNVEEKLFIFDAKSERSTPYKDHGPLNPPSGIDFNDFDVCKDTIINIAAESNIQQQETAVDFTGGTKITSMAATMATTSSDIKAQYIDENYNVMGFDLRFYDLQKLSG